MNRLAAIDKGNALYVRMQAAIAECHRIDECKEIADRAHAVAAYCAQIQDDESLRKFVSIKLRAWRRMGEILLTVEDDCATVGAYVTKIRTVFPTISIGHATQAVKVARMPLHFFEDQLTKATSISGLINSYQMRLDQEWREESPEGQQVEEAERRRQETQRKAWNQEQERETQERRDLNELRAARDDAFAEVGVTLDRRDREAMKSIVLLVKEPIHDTLRQAAFDHRMTMQAIIRAGMAMWFVAHGYAVDPADLPTPLRDTDTAPRHRAERGLRGRT